MFKIYTFIVIKKIIQYVSFYCRHQDEPAIPISRLLLCMNSTYVASTVWTSTKNEWNAQKQSDQANLDLLSLVIWSRMFGHLSRDKLSKAHHCIVASLRRRCNLTWVSNTCKAAPLSLFWAPNRLDELPEERFDFPFILIGIF